jgi:hypothetical protein
LGTTSTSITLASRATGLKSLIGSNGTLLINTSLVKWPGPVKRNV